MEGVKLLTYPPTQSDKTTFKMYSLISVKQRVKIKDS